MSRKRFLFGFIGFITIILISADVSFATIDGIEAVDGMEEDVILGKGGLAETSGNFQRFAGIALLVGVAVSAFIIYKKSK